MHEPKGGERCRGEGFCLVLLGLNVFEVVMCASLSMFWSLLERLWRVIVYFLCFGCLFCVSAMLHAVGFCWASKVFEICP